MKLSFCFSVFLGVVLLFGLTACTTYQMNEGSYAPVQVRDPNAPGTQIRWNNVSLLDRSIQHKIFVEGTNSRRTPTGTLEVWAIFRNRTDYALQLEARASFYDASQAPVESPTAWQRVHLAPNSTASYKSSCMSMIDQGYYNIEVREAR